MDQSFPNQAHYVHEVIFLVYKNKMIKTLTGMRHMVVISSFPTRHYCMNIPEILPKILLAVKWNSRDEVAQVIL